jgi:hypothetical protein
MSRYKTEGAKIRADDPWSRLFEDTKRDAQRHEAYKEACELDRVGKYAEADRVLRKAGVSRAVVQQRRDHINWRLANEGTI